MREIKFRAWDKTLKLMGNVDILEWNKGRKSDGTDKDIVYIRANKPGGYEMQTGSDKHLDEYVLMQFTGLKDKNGKEIYEGDIVEWHPDYDIEKGGKAIIVWDKDQWVPSVEKTGGCDYYGYDGREFNWEELEIIGNIYEHPELIK